MGIVGSDIPVPTRLGYGTERPRLNGERLYVDASYVGKPLYLKLGFNEVGGFLVGDSGVRVTNILWD